MRSIIQEEMRTNIPYVLSTHFITDSNSFFSKITTYAIDDFGKDIH
jgi:hypothetical protein